MRKTSLFMAAAVLCGCGEGTDREADHATYECESGHTIQVSYPTNSQATVEHQGRTLNMEIAVSASGARYVGEGLVWWTKGMGPGSSGLLYRQQPGAADEMLESCTGAGVG